MGATLTACVGKRRVRLVLFEGSRLDNHCLIELTSITSHLDPRDDLFLGGPLLRPPFLDGSLPADTLNDPLDETILFRGSRDDVLILKTASVLTNNALETLRESLVDWRSPTK